jgi:broad specificity phosphatase PhoE
MPKLKYVYLQSLLLARAFTTSATSASNSNIATNSIKPSAMTSTSRFSSTSTSSINTSTTNPKKRILFLRHGQALHNPRAEAARDAGCSHQTFLDLMREDDAFDAPLTPKGIQQAITARTENSLKLNGVQLVVSSPLSRALCTADLAIHPKHAHDDDDGNDTVVDDDSNTNNTTTVTGATNRICIEEFREINGWLLNAKRRAKQDLISTFHPSWNFHQLTAQDEAWTTTLESEHTCAERCYQGLLFLLKERVEERILTVAHGGLLKFVMVHHRNVVVVDGREEGEKRFGNCELREYEVEWTTCTKILDQEERKGQGQDTENTVIVTEERPLIIMTEVR